MFYLDEPRSNWADIYSLFLLREIRLSRLCKPYRRVARLSKLHAILFRPKSERFKWCSPNTSLNTVREICLLVDYALKGNESTLTGLLTKRMKITPAQTEFERHYRGWTRQSVERCRVYLTLIIIDCLLRPNERRVM